MNGKKVELTVTGIGIETRNFPMAVAIFSIAKCSAYAKTLKSVGSIMKTDAFCKQKKKILRMAIINAIKASRGNLYETQQDTNH